MVGARNANYGPALHTATQSLGFPSCCTQALEQVSRVVIATSSLPNQSRSRTNNNELQALLDRDLFCINDRKVCRLSQIQSFSLLRRLAIFFVEEEEPKKDVPMDEVEKNAYRYALFETIFLGREGETTLHNARIQVLFKLASFSLQHPSLTLFIPLAQWLRKMIGRSSHPEELISLLVEHFIQPDPAIRLYDYLVPISSIAPEFGYIFVALAPRENCMGFSMASVVTACLNGYIEGFLALMADFPDKLAVPFAKQSFSCLAKYALQKDENDEEEEEKMKNIDFEIDEDEEEEDDYKEHNEDMKEEEGEDPEEGEIPTDSLEHILSEALTVIVHGWNVRGVKIEINGDILSNMTSTRRRRTLVEALNTQKGKNVTVKKASREN